MLKFLNVKKKYVSQLIIDVASLEIGNGLYWLKGTNGSGKSTFLKMASGMIPFDGEITIDNIHLKKQSVEYRKLVSYAEAEPIYPSYLSGNDLISFYQKVRQGEKQKIDKLIEQLGVDEYYKNNVGTYSSGMLKKLSLVLAFIGNSKYIFLDEPLVTVDQNTLPVIQLLIDEHLKNGVNFVFTSHQPMETSAIELIAENRTVRFV